MNWVIFSLQENTKVLLADWVNILIENSYRY